jgi:hypothetical protein
MIEVEHAEVVFAAIDARMRREIVPDGFERSSSDDRLTGHDDAYMFSPVLGVVTACARSVAGTADVLETVDGRSPDVELSVWLRLLAACARFLGHELAPVAQRQSS